MDKNLYEICFTEICNKKNIDLTKFIAEKVEYPPILCNNFFNRIMGQSKYKLWYQNFMHSNKIITEFTIYFDHSFFENFNMVANGKLIKKILTFFLIHLCSLKKSYTIT
ncbi:hypothetical protein HZS_3724 [Henneguya salminicola]|nr:hypothetical protein HZS_3724 [Henneguya salminicola]